MGDKTELAALGGATICGIAIFLLCLSAIFITELAIGASTLEADNVCIANGVNFGLATWLAVSGGIVLGILGFAILAMICIGVCALIAGEDGAAFSGAIMGGLGICILILHTLFAISWFVVGIVIMAGAPDACSDRYPAVWNMGIASLVFKGLMILGSCSGKKAVSNDEQ